MLEVLWHNLLPILNISCLFYLFTLFSLFQILKQTQLVPFLGYKLLLLLYLGWWLVFNELDIAALILWIVYFSLIVVVFIFAFLWLNVLRPQALFRLSSKNLLLNIVIFNLLTVYSMTFYAVRYTPSFLPLWINYYELLSLYNTEEIECLGWILVVSQALNSLFVSFLLTIACVFAVLLIILAKKSKWLFFSKYLIKVQENNLILAAAIRKQHIPQQEKNMFCRLNKIQKGFHRRRT